MNDEKRMRLGEILINAGILTKTQLKQALYKQKETGQKIGKILIDEGMITEQEIIEVLEFQLGIPHVDLMKIMPEIEVVELVPQSIAIKNTLIPIRKVYNKIQVAMSDPLDIFAIEDVRLITGMDVIPVIASERQIISAIKKYYSQKSAQMAADDLNKEVVLNIQDDLDQQLVQEINSALAVRIVNALIEQAVRRNASDIHIEPFKEDVRIRFRIDGMMREILRHNKQIHPAIITRIKIIGNMDIAERRIPQDGRVEMNIDNKEIDIRVSILPTIHGEKAVLRILDRTNFLKTVEQLGFSRANLKHFNYLMSTNAGLILATGPTGSGKSTTLYSILNKLNKSDNNIITVEDPVEYRIEGINQVQVNNKAGLTFANGLRAILRQDPDIIMVGEIRDLETAKISIRSSITGHLVLSTLHTNDAVSTISRLRDMGIESYLIAASIRGIISQRLVRKVCNNCKKPYKPDKAQIKILGAETDDEKTFYRARGCSICGKTGYIGRTGIHEVMMITKDIRNLISSDSSIEAIKAMSIKNGMQTLKQSGLELIQNGITTFEEVMRVINLDSEDE
ncbi:MAG: GspE/PulE family protein [Clostridia bacterium]|nr:GspE/PulE family protein [Clostridia bacterium]